MQGAQGADSGVLQLAAETIFAQIQATPDREFKLSASYLEIYNEEIRDLLGKDPKKYSAIGDAETMLELLKEFHEAGAHKFILRPIADGHADMIHQTKLLIEELMPRIVKLNNKD